MGKLAKKTASQPPKRPLYFRGFAPIRTRLAMPKDAPTASITNNIIGVAADR